MENILFMAYNPEEILEQYFPENKYQVKSGNGGMNNTTYFVENEGEKYVLRIYETHKDLDKVSYEHYLLTVLGNMELPLGTPLPVKACDGETVKFTGDRKPAALFHYMEGVTPSFAQPNQLKSFGSAAGRLTDALKAVKTKLQPVYRPYYELENTHPKCPIDAVIRFCEKPSEEFIGYGTELLEAAAQLKKFKECRDSLERLPHQLIHGDLNASNVLADKNGDITAVLDFEFVTEDLRVMELCVCLSEILNNKQDDDLLWTRLEAFLEGYGSIIKLSREEVEVVPVLIILRRLDVFIHFLGRYWDGIDDNKVVIDQLQNLVIQARWLDSNNQKLMTLVNKIVD